MPWNLLLIPLLAGFCFISYTHLLRFETSRATRDILLFYSALAGLVLVFASFVVCQALLTTSWGHMIALGLHARLQVPYIGTALGSLMLAPVAIILVNCLVPSEVAAHWAYHKRSYGPLGNLLYGAARSARPRAPVSLAALFLYRFRRRLSLRQCRRLVAMSPPKVLRIRAVMLTLTDDKVYVGLVRMGPPRVARDFDEILIVPLWSGYRDAERRVHKTTDYAHALSRWLVTQGRSLAWFEKVIRTKDIASIGFYDDDVFDGADWKPAPVSRRTNPSEDGWRSL